MKKLTPQEKYDKENMAQVKAKFKKEFVAEFKEACHKLDVSQSSVFREAMEKTIEAANNKKNKKEIIMKTREELIEDVRYKVEQRVREEYQENKWVVEVGFDYPAMWDDVLAYPDAIKFESEEARQEFDDEVIFPLASKVAQEEIEKNIKKL